MTRAVHDGRFDGLALFEMPVDVFDRDRCVIDQDPHSERQTSQRHDVERLADGGKAQNSAENRQRNRDRDDHGGAPTSEK